MRNCREITELVSKDLDKEISLIERLSIAFHVMMCSQCRNFKHQTRFMRKAAQRYTERLQNRAGKKS